MRCLQTLKSSRPLRLEKGPTYTLIAWCVGVRRLIMRSSKRCWGIDSTTTLPGEGDRTGTLRGGMDRHQSTLSPSFSLGRESITCRVSLTWQGRTCWAIISWKWWSNFQTNTTFFHWHSCCLMITRTSLRLLEKKETRHSSASPRLAAKAKVFS